MHSPRQQGRWPARVLVALLVIFTAFALRMWQKQPSSFRSSYPPQPSNLPARQLPWEKQSGAAAQDSTVHIVASREELNSSAAAEISIGNHAPEQAIARPPVASRIEPYGPSLWPLPEQESVEPTLPPSLADELPSADPPPQPPIESPRQSPSPWPAPRSLVEQLHQLEQHAAAAPWCGDVLAALAGLEESTSLAAPEVAASLADLHDQVEIAEEQISTFPYGELSTHWRRVNYSLVRRLAVWQQVHEIAARGTVVPPPAEPSELAVRVAAVEKVLAGRCREQSWSEFLLLEELASLAEGGQSQDEARPLARRALGRLDMPELTDQQCVYLAQPAIIALADELRVWAAEPLDLPGLLTAVENYEQQATPGHAATLARLSRQYALWPREEVVELGHRLDVHWRNANVRVSVSEAFLNLLAPEATTTQESVSDYILGARVQGRSASSTELRICFFPDPTRVRVGLEAQGDIESRTRSHKGPVTLYSDGYGSYHAEKALALDADGVTVWRAEGEAACRTRLRGIDSTFDNIPLVGSMVRNLARSEHDEQRGTVRWEFERRVARHAERRFDDEVHHRLAEAETQFQSRVLQPLEELELEPVAVDMHSTDERAIVRCRVAARDQLSAYTPRPAPLEDSLLNLQIHQSAVNNAVGQLGLDGRRCDLRELYAELAERLGDTSGTVPEEVPHRVTLELAPTQAVHIQCVDGRAMLEIHVNELSRGRRSWHNFTVRAYYEPILDGLRADMARTSSIELEGEGLRLGDQIALRGIFTKVLSRNQRLQLVPDQLLERAAMAGVEVTQFEIEDGWIGVSLGYPHQPREEAVVAEAPTTSVH